MNSAILYLRSHCSPIVKLILFFLFRWSPLSFLFIISFSFLFLPSLILAPISLFSLSLCSTSLPPSPTKPRPEHQVKLISIVMGFFFFFSLWFDVKFGSSYVGYGFGILGRGLMCSRDFMDLSSWVYVRELSTWLVWIIELTDIDRRLDRSHRRGSLRRREGKRETVRPEREDEKNKNKKGIKNYKEIIFKWSCKKK